MDVLLTVEVEVDGATFRFGAADRAMGRLMQDVEALVEARARMREAELGRELMEEERRAFAVVEEADLPDTLFASLCEMFIEGVRGWSGVRDLSRPNETGDFAELPCTPETIREFPSDLKVKVVEAWQDRRKQVEQKKGSAGAPATS